MKMKERIRRESCCENCLDYNPRSCWCRNQMLKKSPANWCKEYSSWCKELLSRSGKKAQL